MDTRILADGTILARYRDILYPIYAEIHPDDLDYYEQVGPDFEKYLINARGNVKVPSPQETATHFRLFLDSQSFPEILLKRRAGDIAVKLAPSARPLEFYEAWLLFVNHFVKMMQNVEVAVRRALKTESDADWRAAETIISQSERFAKTVDEKIGANISRLPRIFKIIISSQRGIIKNIQSVMGMLKLVSDTPSYIPEIDIKRAITSAVESIRTLYDPLEWVEKAYTNIESIEKLYHKNHDDKGALIYTQTEQYSTTPSNEAYNEFGAMLTVPAKRPHLRPEDPGGIRDLIDYIVLTAALMGTKKTPIKLSFAWEKDKSSIVITASNLKKMSGHYLWAQVVEFLKVITEEEDGIDFKNHKIVIPVKLSTGKRASSPPTSGNAGPSEGGGSESSGSGTATDISTTADPSSISGFYYLEPEDKSDIAGYYTTGREINWQVGAVHSAMSCSIMYYNNLQMGTGVWGVPYMANPIGSPALWNTAFTAAPI